MNSKVEKLLDRLYTNLESPSGLSSLNDLYKYAIEENPNVTKSSVENSSENKKAIPYTNKHLINLQDDLCISEDLG